MNTSATLPAGLTAEQTRAVLAAARTAPSPYGTRPWRLVTSTTGIGLHLDRDRLLPAADPDRQQALLACGAALLNLRLAIRVLDRHTDVRLLPDPGEPDLLAVVRPEGHHPALPSEHRLTATPPVPSTRDAPFRAPGALTAARSGLNRAAATEQAWLVTATGHRLGALRRLLADAHAQQVADPEFLAEWSRHVGHDGPGDQDADRAGLPPPPQLGAVDAEHTLVAVIGSFLDTTRARLQAGQACQRVMLTAAAEGLSAASLAPVVQVPATRARLRTLLGGGIWPQALLRLGTGSAAFARRSGRAVPAGE